MPPRNEVKTERLQLSLDPQSYRILTEMAGVGLYGKSEGEVGSFVLRTWILANRNELSQLGIRVVKKRAQES
jgi:hypothetical protein